MRGRKAPVSVLRTQHPQACAYHARALYLGVVRTGIQLWASRQPKLSRLSTAELRIVDYVATMVFVVGSQLRKQLLIYILTKFFP